MHWTTKRTALALLGLVGLILAGATVLGPDEPTHQTLGPAGTALSSPDTDRTESGGDTTAITLGDLKPPPVPTFPPAPIDPCTVIGPADLPPETQPIENPHRTPDLLAAEQLGCRLDFPSAADSSALLITITWTELAAWPGPLDPTKYPDAAVATFAGRPGLERTVTDAQGKQVCLGLMPAGAGITAARVSNTRYPAVHPCAVASAVLTAVAHKTP